MRKLAVAIVVLAVLAVMMVVAIGALHVGSNEDTISVTIDKKQVKEKAERGIEQARDAGTAILHRTGEALQKASGKPQAAPPKQQPSATAPEKTDSSPH